MYIFVCCATEFYQNPDHQIHLGYIQMRRHFIFFMDYPCYMVTKHIFPCFNVTCPKLCCVEIHKISGRQGLLFVGLKYLGHLSDKCLIVIIPIYPLISDGLSFHYSQNDSMTNLPSMFLTKHMQGVLP